MPVDEPMERENIGGFCALHPESESVGLCVSCGRRVCEICKFRVLGRIFCKSCIEAGKAPVGPVPGADPRSYFGVVGGRLAAERFLPSTDRMEEFEVTVWYKREVVMLNVAHTFLIMAVAGAISRETIHRFCGLCESYSLRHNPGTRGLSLLLCYPVLAGWNIDSGAREYAAFDFRKGYLRITIPVLVDLARHEVTCLRETPFVAGAAYLHGKNFILRHLVF